MTSVGEFLIITVFSSQKTEKRILIELFSLWRTSQFFSEVTSWNTSWNFNFNAVSESFIFLKFEGKFDVLIFNINQFTSESCKLFQQFDIIFISNKTTRFEDFSPIISQSFWFGFVEIDGFDELIISVDAFVKFFSWDSFSDFGHKRKSFSLILFFDGIDFFLHFIIKFSFLFFDLIDGSPGEFFFFILDFQDSVLDSFQ